MHAEHARAARQAKTQFARQADQDIQQARLAQDATGPAVPAAISP